MTTVRSVFVGLVMVATLGGATLGADSREAPFKGQGLGEIVQQEVLAPDHVRLTTVSQGHATLLGRFVRVEVIDLNPSTGSFTGWLAFLGANGALVFAEMTGQFFSATDASGEYTIVGGTGRFGHASGQAAFKASMIGETAFRFSFDGELER